MQLLESSTLKKIIALGRFILITVFYLKRLRISKISYIGKNFKIFISKKGEIQINGKIRINDNVELKSQGKLIIGNGCGINSYSRMIAFDRITLGDNVLIAQFVSILDHDHNFEDSEGNINLKNFSTSPIEIGNNVWIGDKVTITKGIKIGDNVIIGANSVVTKDIPSNSLAAGIPAKVLKELT